MNITVYGPEGCNNCTQLKQTTEEVVERNNLDAEVTKESDMTKLAQKGVMSTPGFEIGDEMVLTGTTPSADKLEEILTDRV
ncbi:thioredoxin family protein [Halorubrum sp. N11]|uniref:thioredoxin family protein n=1 Tax=Halorubrum sp. N11 TaxID=3402276 RepID=UPI003EBF0BDA